MSMRRNPGLWLVLGAVAVAAPACDPIFGVYARQTLSPAPELACVLAVMDSSPHVIGWAPRDDPEARRFRVFFRDDASHRRPPMAYVTFVAPPDSAAVVGVELVRIHGPTLNERLGTQRFAGRILSDVRTACAPASPEPPTCEYTGWGGRRTCPLGDPAAETDAPPGS